MRPRLYGELVGWYRLLDPTADHADEAACYEAAFEQAASPRPETLPSSAPAPATTRAT